MSPSAVTLSSGAVRLRVVEPRDLEALYRLVSSEDLAYRWRYRGSTPSPDDFRRDLWKDTLAQFVVETTPKQELVGLVSAYHANHRNQTAYLSLIATPEFGQTGVLMIAAELFVSFVFQNWNFRKLYSETLEFNLVQFKSAFGDRGPFREEGRLRDYEFFDGRFWDLIISSVDRGTWESSRKLFHEKSAGLARAFRGDRFDETTFCKLIDEICEADGRSSPEARLDDRLVDDLGFDSLEMLQLIDTVEEIAGRLIGDRQLPELTTVRDWYLLLLELVQLPPVES